MFTCYITSGVHYSEAPPLHPITVCIAGCPSSGIPAVDYRRAHGLPAAPSDTIVLPPTRWEDEDFIRAHEACATDCADLQWKRQKQEDWHCNAAGEVYGGAHYLSNGHVPALAPEAIRAYLESQTPETGRGLFTALWSHSAASLAAAGREATECRQRERERAAALEAARVLLAEEIGQVTRERDRLARDLERTERERDEALAALDEGQDATTDE